MADIREEIAALREKVRTFEPDENDDRGALAQTLIARNEGLWDAVELLAAEVARPRG